MQMDYSTYNPVASFEEKAFENYLTMEEQFMPAEVYIDSNEAILRKKAIRVILENSKCDNFDAFIPYLAMNYFDRYISRNPLPNVVGSVREEIVLVANCCLMLAWKMRQSTFKVLEFLAKTNMIEHQRHILPVELAILNGLNWRMRAVTAICFVDMFVRRIPVAKKIRRRTINQIVIQAQGDITFTKFKPSVLAAAALLTACKIKYNHLYQMCEMFVLHGEYVNEDDLKGCEEKAYQMCIDKRILMERDEQEPQVEGSSQAGESSSSISHRPGKEPVHATSEIQEIDDNSDHRPGKEPVHATSEIQEIDDNSDHRPGKEPVHATSEIQEIDDNSDHRPGKEPVSEITEIKEEVVMASKSENDPEMNFQLKWILWSNDAAEITIDSPLFRSVASAAETTSADNDNPARTGDRNRSVSCSPLTLQCMGCNYL